MSLNWNWTKPMNQLLLNNPMELHWAGWRASSYDLYRAGWEFSMMEEPEQMAMTLAVQHRDGDVRGYGRFSIEELRYASQMKHGRELPPVARMSLGFGRDLVIQVQESLPPFLPVRPTSPADLYDISVARRHHRASDFANTWFRQLPPPSEDVRVVEPTFDEILNMALAKQAPKQKEIREKMMRDRGRRDSGLIITCAA